MTPQQIDRQLPYDKLVNQEGQVAGDLESWEEIANVNGALRRSNRIRKKSWKAREGNI